MKTVEEIYEAMTNLSDDQWNRLDQDQQIWWCELVEKLKCDFGPEELKIFEKDDLKIQLLNLGDHYEIVKKNHSKVSREKYEFFSDAYENFRFLVNFAQA